MFSGSESWVGHNESFRQAQFRSCFEVVSVSHYCLDTGTTRQPRTLKKNEKDFELAVALVRRKNDNISKTPEKTK